MEKEYVFDFIGTKEDFLNTLNLYHHNTSYNGNEFYYFDDYIVKICNGVIHFGVERGGHSGGYWYIPLITEYEERIEFSGTVEYIGPEDNRGRIKKVIDGIGLSVLIILVLPIILLIWLYMLFEWIIRKLIKKQRAKAKTTEEKLFDLMENHLGCIRK